MYGAREQPIALEVPERNGQHSVADLADLTVQLGEPATARPEELDDEQRPLVGQAIEKIADLA